MAPGWLQASSTEGTSAIAKLRTLQQRPHARSYLARGATSSSSNFPSEHRLAKLFPIPLSRTLGRWHLRQGWDLLWGQRRQRRLHRQSLGSVLPLFAGQVRSCRSRRYLSMSLAERPSGATCLSTRRVRVLDPRGQSTALGPLRRSGASQGNPEPEGLNLSLKACQLSASFQPSPRHRRVACHSARSSAILSDYSASKECFLSH